MSKILTETGANLDQTEIAELNLSESPNTVVMVIGEFKASFNLRHLQEELGTLQREHNAKLAKSPKPQVMR